jgi:hypothetical protein
MWQMEKNKLHIQGHSDSYVLYEGGGGGGSFFTHLSLFSILNAAMQFFQTVTHKIIFIKLFSDKSSSLCTTTSRHKFLVNSMNSA